jgi:hypothetical protein
MRRAGVGNVGVVSFSGAASLWLPMRGAGRSKAGEGEQ